METLSSAFVSRHIRLHVSTDHPTQFIDLTEQIDALIAQSGIRLGMVNVQTLHTTTAVVVNEHEPLLLTDFAALLERIAPADAGYRHDEALARTANVIAGERINGHAHCRALCLAPSASLNIVDGALVLGRWQRVFLVELDGPRDREVSVALVGEAEG